MVVTVPSPNLTFKSPSEVSTYIIACPVISVGAVMPSVTARVLALILPSLSHSNALPNAVT